MLTDNNYLKGIELNEQIKYNIAYERDFLFDVVFAGLASRLLKHEYSEELTEQQKSILTQIINN